ncbi:hypothetical protein ACLOJK_003006 [Asimina triloba]
MVKSYSQQEQLQNLASTERWPLNADLIHDGCPRNYDGLFSILEKKDGIVYMKKVHQNIGSTKEMEPTSARLRPNYYPLCPSPDLALGVVRRKDGGALTVLVQDNVGGLNVKRMADGQWVRVKPISNSYVINVGDIIQGL